ncbi:MAG: hypothetical protein WC860_07110 [Candidatus Margulisiibacteriota bacterium]|jgi:hypothetical protein
MENQPIHQIESGHINPHKPGFKAHSPIPSPPKAPITEEISPIYSAPTTTSPFLDTFNSIATTAQIVQNQTQPATKTPYVKEICDRQLAQIYYHTTSLCKPDKAVYDLCPTFFGINFNLTYLGNKFTRTPVKSFFKTILFAFIYLFTGISKNLQLSYKNFAIDFKNSDKPDDWEITYQDNKKKEKTISFASIKFKTKEDQLTFANACYIAQTMFGADSSYNEIKTELQRKGKEALAREFTYWCNNLLTKLNQKLPI